jgi:hypothetical protein
MTSIEEEIALLRGALTRMPSGNLYDRLYAVQQALVWVTDPRTFHDPIAMIFDTLEGSKGCPAKNDRSEFSDSLGRRDF